MTLSAHCHNSWDAVAATAAAAGAVGGIIYMAAALETNRCIRPGVQRPQLLKVAPECACGPTYTMVCMCV